MINHDFIILIFQTQRHVLNHINNQIRKQVILRSSHISESEKKESIIYLYFLSSNENYKNHISLNLTDKIWSSEKWTEIWVMINSECTFIDIINMKYVKKWQLNIQKLEYDTLTREFNRLVF